jgi:hypothetical protein
MRQRAEGEVKVDVGVVLPSRVGPSALSLNALLQIAEFVDAHAGCSAVGCVRRAHESRAPGRRL